MIGVRRAAPGSIRPLVWLVRTLAAAAALPLLGGLSIWVAWRLVVAMWVADPLGVEAFYRKAIPEQIDVGPMIMNASTPSTAVLLLVPVPRACGGVAFELTDKALGLISEQDLAALGPGLMGRGEDLPNPAGRFVYEDWAETPVPPDWIGGEGTWRGPWCMDREFAEIVYREAGQDGSFYTRSRSRTLELVVLPRLRILLLTYTK